MDRNSAIGMTLIAVLLMVYFYFFSTPSTPQATKKTDSVAAVLKKEDAIKGSKIDSAVIQSYGNLGSLLQGSEEFTKVENEDLRIVLSNKGFISELELKKFKTYSQKPLYLIFNNNNSFAGISPSPFHLL